MIRSLFAGLHALAVAGGCWGVQACEEGHEDFQAQAQGMPPSTHLMIKPTASQHCLHRSEANVVSVPHGANAPLLHVL